MSIHGFSTKRTAQLLKPILYKLFSIEWFSHRSFCINKSNYFSDYKANDKNFPTNGRIMSIFKQIVPSNDSI